ncbi:hypothetical protein ACP70R_032565 [Stipagrostis hirtigluma subsp. patula]
MAAALVKLDESPILAAANYGVLPVDVLFDVLLRLPANELCRLRLVCWCWRSLTSDPLFAKAHSSCHPHVVAIHRSEVHVVDLSGNVLKRIHLNHHGNNLTTQLDLLYVSIGWRYHQAYALNVVTGMVEHSTQTSSSELTSVLGHVPSTGEYKVLRIIWREACEVITLGSGNNGGWRRRPCPPVVKIIAVSSRYMVQFGGVAYFKVDGPLATTEIESDSIASFDLATEEWRPTLIRGPLRQLMKYPTGIIYLCLAKLNDCLVTIHYNYQDVSRDLWFSEDTDKSLWTKRYSVQCEGGPLRGHHPLLILEDGRVVFFVDQYLRSYDTRTSTWTDLTTMRGYHSVRMHHGSLLCSGKRGDGGAVVDAAGEGGDMVDAAGVPQVAEKAHRWRTIVNAFRRCILP